MNRVTGVENKLRISKGGSGGKESAFNAKRPGFDSWVGKIPWRREWLLTPVSLPGEFHGQRSLVGNSPWLGVRVTKSWTRLSDYTLVKKIYLEQKRLDRNGLKDRSVESLAGTGSSECRRTGEGERTGVLAERHTVGRA